MTAIFILAVAVAVSVGGYIWKGYVLSILWKWFIVAFFGLPALTIPMAIGLTLIASFLTAQYYHNTDDRDPWSKLGTAVGHEFFYPLVVLGIGWIVLQFL